MDNQRAVDVEDAVKLPDRNINLIQNPRKIKMKEDNWDTVRKKKQRLVYNLLNYIHVMFRSIQS